jgi:hypothetical protein
LIDEPSLLSLPNDLPDNVYASWVAALRALRESTTTALANERQQFCTAYLQALEDAQVIDPHIARMLHTEVQALSVAVRAVLNTRIP